MTYDVVIAGAGPVGLFLACELGLAGTSVLVLERSETPDSLLKAGWMGMRGLNLPSVEAFYRRGMLKELRKSSLAWLDPARSPGIELSSAKTADSPPTPRFAGHFAGIMLSVDKIDPPKQKYLMGGPSAGGGLASLEGLELLLAERALELGVEIRHGMGVTGFTQDNEGVTVQAGDESFKSEWLVGCDGGRSTVRKLAEFEFAGTDPEFTGYSAWVEIADPEKLRPGFNPTATGMYVCGPGPGRIGMIEFDDNSRSNTGDHSRRPAGGSSSRFGHGCDREDSACRH